MMTGPPIASPLLAAAAGTSDVLLPLLILVPLLGALAVALVRDPGLTRALAVGVATSVLVLAGLLLARTPGVPTVLGQVQSEHVWAAPEFLRLSGNGGAGWAFGASLSSDAISAWLVALTAVLTPCAMLATQSGLDRARAYYAWMLVLEASILGAFLASDLLLFYVFFELTLVPSFFLIGQWGGVERRHAATKFFVYTFAGSLFMLAAILYLAFHAGTFDIRAASAFAQDRFTHLERTWVLVGLLAGLAVKVPLLPLHTWLPVTYTQAPAPVTAIVAGALGKLGTYGLLRIAVPVGFLPVDPAHPGILPWVVAACVLAIVYAALIAWAQRDYKTLVAYSSISHLGFCVLALACLSTMGGQASVLYMVNHGISTAALFLLLGFIEQRLGTRLIEGVSGLGRERPRLAFFFVLFVMSSIGLPLTNGFVSEFLAIQSVFARGWITAGILAATGVVLGAIYMLHLTGKLIFGPARQPADVTGPMPDLNRREVASLLPLAALVLVLGVRPNLVLDSIRAPVSATLNGASSMSPATPAAVRSDRGSTRGVAALDPARRPDRLAVGVVSVGFDSPHSQLPTPH